MQIDGPDGPLEARYDPPQAPSGAQAVLCHPHPDYGGSMDDAVLDTVAGRLLNAGVGVLRFNFRGVEGALEDLLTAVDWLSRTHPPTTSLWVGGYSFGAWVVWRALAAGLRADRVLLVAPPVGRMDFGPLPDRGAGPGIVNAIAGSTDSFVDAAALQALPGVATTLLDHTDHFFSGRQRELAAAVDEVVAGAD